MLASPSIRNQPSSVAGSNAEAQLALLLAASLAPLLRCPQWSPAAFHRVCICGTGNGAHVFAAVMAAKGIEVTIYSPRRHHIEKWYAPAPADRLRVTASFPDGVAVTGMVQLVTDDPAAAAHGADLVIVCLPNDVHDTIITAIAPHLRPGTPIGTVQGGWWGKPPLPGMEDKAAFIMGTLPWACRIITFGQEVQVLGSKDFVTVGASSCDTMMLCMGLQAAIGIPMRPAANMLSVSALFQTMILHPGIMYGRLQDWDGEPFAEPMLFYQGVDDADETVLLALTADFQALMRRLKEVYPQLDLSSATLYEWLLETYSSQIDDKSSLKRALQTNAAYQGLKFPMEPAPSGKGFVPMFNYRYLTSNAAIELMIVRGIAELAGVPTPMLDRVLLWAQERLGQEWLRDGKVGGRDIACTRTPQRFGITTLDALMLSAECASQH